MAEATRNVACTGATPIAITDCLNFGNPDKPHVYWQLEECIKGMAKACKTLGVPVISGNVSLYNESQGEPIYPTPIVGALGLIDEVSKACSAGFKAEGDEVYIIGPAATELAGSEYLDLIHKKIAGKPKISLTMERRVQRFIIEAIKQGLLKSAHDCSDGGLAVALAECSILTGVGFRWSLRMKGRADVNLFGEGQSRVVVSTSADKSVELAKLTERFHVPITKLGVTGGKFFSLGTRIKLSVEKLTHAYETGLAAGQ